MSKRLTLIIIGIYSLIVPSIGQTNKLLGSELHVQRFTPTPLVLFHSDGTTYEFLAKGNPAAYDTMEFSVYNPDGTTLIRKRLNTLSGNISPNSAFWYGNDILLILTIEDSIKIQNTVYKARKQIGSDFEMYGRIGIVLDKNLEIKKQFFIALSQSFGLYSLVYQNSGSLLFSSVFSDTVDLRPCGGSLIRSPKDSLGYNCNYGYLELDTNFRFKKLTYTQTINAPTFAPYFGTTSRIQRKVGGHFDNKDTLRYLSLRKKSSLNLCPFLFTLDSNLEVKKAIFGERITPGNEFVYSQLRAIFEDKDYNNYISFYSFGKFKFAGQTIGVSNDYSSSIVKIDSSGNGLWAKTLSTGMSFVYGWELLLDTVHNQLLYGGALEDTFSVGDQLFSIPRGSKQEVFASSFDLNGNFLNFRRIGFQVPNAAINDFRFNRDSSGNFYTILRTTDAQSFNIDCQTITYRAVQGDSSRRIWLKFGPSTLKKDSILKHWDICTGQGQIKAFYKTNYPDLQYKWNTQTVDSTFSFSQGGNYRLIVKDATCYADTNYFKFAPKAIIAEPSIIGANQANNIGAFLYNISAPDSLQINWQLAGGQLVSGQGTDSIYVNWSAFGQGLVSYTLTGLQSGCRHSDSLSVLITSNNSIIDKNSQFKIYPNPTDNIIIILTKRLENTYFNLTNILGHSIANGYFINGHKQIDLTNLDPGIYILKINSETIKVVKN